MVPIVYWCHRARPMVWPQTSKVQWCTKVLDTISKKQLLCWIWNKLYQMKLSCWKCIVPRHIVPNWVQYSSVTTQVIGARHKGRKMGKKDFCRDICVCGCGMVHKMMDDKSVGFNWHFIWERWGTIPQAHMSCEHEGFWSSAKLKAREGVGFEWINWLEYTCTWIRENELRPTF